MQEKFLSIGSVITLKIDNKKIMITGFLAQDKKKNNRTYDYCGCLFPEGIISSNRMLIFNHEDIKNVLSLGYSDSEWLSYEETLKKYVK